MSREGNQPAGWFPPDQRTPPLLGSRRGARGEAEREAVFIDAIRISLLKTGSQQARVSGRGRRVGAGLSVFGSRTLCDLEIIGH